MYYAEQKGGLGSWQPIKLSEPPSVDSRGRLKRTAEVGPVMRKMGDAYCKPIDPSHQDLCLNDLQKIYSSDYKTKASTSIAPPGLG